MGKIQSKSIPAGGLGEGFDDGTFTINGKELTRLEMPTDEELEASDVRLWLKPQVRELGIVVNASTEILIDPKNFVPTAGLVINGTTVVEEESLLALDADERTKSAELNTRDKTALKLRDNINEKTEITGVGAYINPDGILVVNNRTGKNINIEGVSASNVLSITSTEYRGEIEMLRTVDQVRVLPRDMNFDEGLTINNVALGAPGTFSDVETVRDAINSASGLGSIPSISEINSLSPFGSGNPEPRFVIENLKLLKSSIVGEKHIKALLSAPDGSVIKSVTFNAVKTDLESYLLLKNQKKINIVGKLSLNEWKGQKNVEFIIDDISVNKTINNSVPSSNG